MRRLVQGLAFAVLLGFALPIATASASTIDVKPNPTDSFKVFGSFDPPFPQTFVNYDDFYEFTLTKTADLTGVFMQTVQNGSTAFGLEDSSHHTIGTTNIAPGDYFLHIVILAFGGGTTIYGGHADFTAVTSALTPIPGSLLLLTTALGGLGFAGFRQHRRRAAA